MKTITTLFNKSVLFASIVASLNMFGQCQYELTLLDSYGDGWNGNSMNVQVAGFAPSNLTLNSGSSISYTIGIGLGETISFSWQGGGPFQDECSYTVKDLFTGSIIYSSPIGNQMSTSTPQFTTQCSSTGTTPCLFTSPYLESFSGSNGGWVAPSSQFNTGSINSCWNRNGVSYQWVKAPFPGSSPNLGGPSADNTNGGQGFIGSWSYPFVSTLDSSTELITPYISLDDDQTPQVAFWYHLLGEDIRRLEFSISTDTAGPWTAIDTLYPNTGAFVNPASPWHQVYYDIFSYAGDTVSFKFTAIREFGSLYSGIDSRISIDDFSVYEDTMTCDKPIKVELTSIGVSNAQITWEPTSASSYEVQWGQSTTAPIGSPTTIVSANQFSLTSLAPNSSYTFRVRGICSSGNVSEWSEFITIETDCGAFLAPWNEDFESSDWVVPFSWFDQGDFGDCFLDSGNLSFYWRVSRTPYNQDAGPNTDHSPSGPGNYLAANATGNSAPADWSFTTPWIALDSLTNPELKFWIHAFSKVTAFGTLTTKVQTLGGGITAVFDTSGAFQGSQSAAWKEMVVPLNYGVSDTIRVIFNYKLKTIGFDQPFSIDDISVESAPTCQRPKYLRVESVTSNSVDLRWSTVGALNHELRYKKDNSSAWTVLSLNTNQTTITGLDPNTKYIWEVRNSCSSTDQSVWVRGPNFYTQCVVFTAPIIRSFTNNQWQGPSPLNPSGTIGNCFTRLEGGNSGYYWTGARSGYDHYVFTGPDVDHTPGPSGYFFANASSQAADTANMELPEVYLGQLLSPEFSFWYHMYGDNIDRLNVFIRRRGRSDSLLTTIIGEQQTSAGQPWLQKTCSLNGYQNDTVTVTFQAIKNNLSSIFFGSLSSATSIDDISFTGTLNCPAPTQLTATNINPTSATISWQGVSSTSILEFGPAGFTLGNGTVINPATSPTLLSGLQPSTSYSVFVKDSCTANLLSANASVNFTTGPCPPVIALGNVTLAGATVTAINTSNSQDSILWDWGNGAFSTLDSASYTYTTSNIYLVKQIVFNDCGSVDSTTYTITVCGAVTSSFVTTSSSLSIAFDASLSIGAGLTYQWDFGDGFTSSATSPTHVYNISGTYLVTLTTTDACGTSATSSQLITACAPVGLSYNTSNSGSQFTFNATPSGLASYQWDFGDGTTGSGQTTTHTYQSSGNFKVELTALDTCSGSLTYSDTVSTCPPLSADFTFSIVSTSANGLLVSFLANVSGSSGLLWVWGDGTQTTTPATSIAHSFPAISFNYVVRLYAFNDCGDTVQVTRSLNEVGLEELNNTFSLYPNPNSTELLNVVFPNEATQCEIGVWDLSGRNLSIQRFENESQVKLDIANLSPGMYLVRIEKDGVIMTQPFIKL